MTHTIRRRQLFQSVAAVPLTLVAACATPATPAQPAQPAQPTQPSQTAAAVRQASVTDLTWWTTGAGIIDSLAKEYGDAHAMTVTTQNQGGYDDMVAKVQAGIMANSLPHLATLGQRHGIAQIADSGRLIPLADLAAADPAFALNDFLPAFLKRYTYKNVIRVLPFIPSSPILHYNRTAFQTAGLNPDTPPTTLDEVVAVATRLTQRSGQTFTQVGLNTAGDYPWYAYALVWENGGALFDASGATPSFNQPPGVAALRWWKDAVHTQTFMPPNQHNTAEQDFTAGKVGMLFASSSATGGYEQQIGTRFDYGVARFPSIGTTRSVPVGGAGLGVFSSDDAHQAAAWDLAKWLTSPEVNARIVRETGYVAVRQATLDLPDLKAFLANNPRRALGIQQVREDIHPESANPADSSVWLGMAKVQDSLEADAHADPKTLLNALADDTSKYLKNY